MNDAILNLLIYIIEFNLLSVANYFIVCQLKKPLEDVNDKNLIII